MMIYIRNFVGGVIIALFTLTASAADVDTVTITSRYMSKAGKCVVIKPGVKDSLALVRYPVVYLLHGYSGDYSNWIKKVPALASYADNYQVIIVCPDGGYSSWYFDSPVDSAMRYERYIAREVPEFIDNNYPTIRSRSARAITGLSMGGHGALFLAMRNQDVFGACGSMSGGVDLSAVKRKFDVVKRLGDTTRHAKNWIDYSVVSMAAKYPLDSLAIMIDCGVDDFFFADNQRLHARLADRKVKHDYVERAGSHDWKYWENAVVYQLVFFNRFFKKST